MQPKIIAKFPELVSADALVYIHEPGKVQLHSENPHLRKHIESFVRDVEGKKSRREWFCTLEKGAGGRTSHLLLESATFGNPAPHDEPLKMAAARAVALCREYSLSKIAFIVHHELAPAKAAAIAEGALLGDFNDRRFKGEATRKQPRPRLELQFLVPEKSAKEAEKAVKERVAIAEATNTARELTNAPHHVLTPATMAAHARALARKYKMACTVLDEKQLKKAGYLPTWEVGRGSEYPPRMMVLRYRPARARVRDHIGLVGKGMTFDTGGLCIKTRQDMYRMNNDMGGAAAVLGAMEAVARLKLPIRITAIIGSAHNAVDGAAYHPGAILKAKNGKTIFVENTDAEGRLVLSDCLHRAGEEKVDQIWDFATLTGSVSAALGSSFGGLFTDDEELRALLIEAGQNSGEALWPLPLPREYEASLKHELADLNNVSSDNRAGGIHAANFLKQFVPEGKRWAHVDIAGVAATAKPFRYLRTGGTGFGVRLIVEALRLLASRAG